MNKQDIEEFVSFVKDNLSGDDGSSLQLAIHPYRLSAAGRVLAGEI